MPKGVYKHKKGFTRVFKKRNPLSEETKRKISRANKGKKLSLEHRNKLSKSKIGHKGYWLGKKREKSHGIFIKGDSRFSNGEKSHFWKGGISKDKTFYRRQRHYLERNAIGSHTKEDWERIKKGTNYCCVMCGMQEPFTELWYQNLTEDHIIPLSKGGTNYLSNIQPLCARCNSIKHNNILNL